MRGGHGAQVVGGLESAQPGQGVGVVQLLAAGTGDVDVQALRLVDPFLAARGGLDQPLRLHFKRRGVKGLQFLRHAVDLAQRAVEVLEVHHHHFVPQAEALEVAHQRGIDDGELAAQVALDRQVAKARFYGSVDADDVADGGGGRNRHAVGVAHAVLADAGAQDFPVQRAAAVHLHIAAARLLQQVQAVQRQNALVPQ